MKRGISTIGPGGIYYRSRLECKYALLFEFLDFSYNYEPIDLSGYIPDFILYFGKKRKLLVEIKSDLIYDFREAAEKIFKSGYNQDCIIFGSKSPYWDKEKKKIILDARYLKPSTVKTCEKEAWYNVDETEYYFDKRKKKLWTIYDDIGILFCNDCYNIVICYGDICVNCHHNHLIFKNTIRKIPEAWNQFCNQTQWKKKKIDEPVLKINKDEDYYPILSKPKLKHFKSESFIDQNDYHAMNRKELLSSLFKQMTEKKEAYFCEKGLWDWDQVLEILDEVESFYVCCKEGFCCDMNYIIVESCNLKKIQSELIN